MRRTIFESRSGSSEFSCSSELPDGKSELGGMNGCKPVVRGGLSNLYYAAEEKRIQKVNRRGKR
jgi:hypothetical protein